MRDPGVVARVAALAVAAGLVLAACASQPSHPQPPRTRRSTLPAAAHPLPTALQQQTERFVHRRDAANPSAVMILTSSRNLRTVQRGVVLTVRSIGDLVGSCGQPRPALTLRVTYRGPGPPVVTEVRHAQTRPIGLYLMGGVPPQSPTGGKQQFAFFQVVAGGEAADFALVLWATITTVPGGCTFSTNGVLRVRCTAFADQICSYIARRSAWAHLG